MKNLYLLKAFLIFFFSVLWVHNSSAQSLKKFTPRDTLFHSYILNGAQLEYILKENQIKDTSWFYSQVYRRSKRSLLSQYDSIEYGSYLEVSIVENTVNYSLVEKKPFSISFKKIDDDIVMYLKTQGSTNQPNELITDAFLFYNGTKIGYDSSYGGYSIPVAQFHLVKGLKYLTILYHSRFYISTLDYYSPPKYKQPKYKKPFNPIAYGYCITDKPIYKLGDSVRYKAYLVNDEGVPITSHTILNITDQFNGKLVYSTSLKNSSEGAYVFQWTLPDTLLQDRNYNINIGYKDGKNRWVSRNQSFRIESYILDKSNINFSPAKYNYRAGETLEFKANTTDANGFPIGDVRLQYLISILQVNEIETDTLSLTQRQRDSFYYIDTILPYDKIHNFSIDYKKLPRASMSLNVRATMTDPQFEKKEFNFNLNYNAKEHETIFYQKEDSIVLEHKSLNVPTQKEFTLKCFNLFNKMVDSLVVKSPYSYKLSPKISRVELHAKNEDMRTLNVLYNALQIVHLEGEKKARAIKISFKYPFEAPVFYRIKKGNQVVAKGSSKEINYTAQDSTLDEYSILISHNLNGNIENNCFKFYFYPLNKSVQIINSIPETAFPGQTIPMEITATDWYGHPIKNFNLASYAVNNQFKERISEPYIEIPANYKLSTRNETIGANNIQLTSHNPTFQNAFLITKKHIEEFSLHKNEFYQLLFPQKGYQLIRNKKQFETPEITVIATYRGKTHIPKYFTLNNELWAVSEVNKPHNYSFVCDTGLKNITIRVFDLAINIPKIYVSPYTKHYIALNLDSIYAKSYSDQIQVTDSLSFSTPIESERIKIENSLLFFNGLYVDSVLRVINTPLLSKRFTFYSNQFESIQVDDDDLNAMGPFSQANISLMNKYTKTTLQSGRYTHYCNNFSQPTTKEMSKRTNISLTFQDQVMSYAYIPYLTEPDTLVPDTTTVITKVPFHPPVQKSIFNPSIYQYHNSNNYDYNYQIHLLNSSKKQITNCWIINKKNKYRSQFYANCYYNRVLNTYNAKDSIDIYLFTNENKMRIFKNVVYDNNVYLYVNPDTLATYEVDEEELAYAIKLFNKITEIPKLPFYYDPETSRSLHLESSEFHNVQGVANWSGTLITKTIAPIEGAYILLEKNGVFLYGATTNRKGEFEFLAIPEGTYDIKIYHPNYSLKFYYQVSIGGKYQQYCSIILKEKSGQVPRYESITNNYRLSVFKSDGLSTLKVNVYDLETHQMLKDAMAIWDYGTETKKIPSIHSQTQTYENTESSYYLRILDKNHNTATFHIRDLEIENETVLDVFLSPLNTSKTDQYELELDLWKSHEEQRYTFINKENNVQSGDIQGTVLNELGDPVSFAQVVLVEDEEGNKLTGKGAKANAQGFYSIKNLKSGKYNVMVKSLGIGKMIKKDIPVYNGKITELNLRLYKADVITNNVIVGAARKTKKTLKDVYSPKENSLSEEEVKEVSVRDVNSMASTSGSVVYANAPTAMKMESAREDGNTIYIDGIKISGNAEKLGALGYDMDDEEGEEHSENPTVKIDSTMDKLFKNILNSGNGTQFRKTFSDVGYWAPNLVTDAFGKAYTTFTLPDNITQWKSFTIGMGRGFSYGQTSQFLKVYKPMQTITYTPTFLHQGDSIYLKAKFTNLMSEPKTCNTFFELNNIKVKSNTVELKTYLNDSILVVSDSLKPLSFTAGLDYQSSYKDAENMTIPVLSNAISIFNNQNVYADVDSTYYIDFKENTKGSVIFNNSIYENILKYIEDLNQYQYGCVEQTASKLKALLYQQEIYNKLNIIKNVQKQINKMASKLEEMQNKDGSFGWWKKCSGDNYMTTYAYEALAHASNRNYNARSQKAAHYLIKQVEKGVTPELLYPTYILVKNRQMEASYLHLDKLDERLLNTTQKIYYYKLKQMKGESIDGATWYGLLLELNNNTRYSYNDNFFYDARASVFNAFTIFKGTSVEPEFNLKFKKQITQGLLANNLNTFSKAALIEAMISDAKDGDKTILSELVLNDKIKVNTYPYTIPIQFNRLKIQHKGAPIWVNTSEEEQIENPNVHDSIFKISTQYVQSNHSSTKIKRGISTQLVVDISTYKTKEYVMIEIPLPAGVIIKNKVENHYSRDYIEYKNDKILIYKTIMPMGETQWKFDIEPIYKGSFRIPPAQISMMYYPFVFGNNQASRLTIE